MVFFRFSFSPFPYPCLSSRSFVQHSRRVLCVSRRVKKREREREREREWERERERVKRIEGTGRGVRRRDTARFSDRRSWKPSVVEKKGQRWPRVSGDKTCCQYSTVVSSVTIVFAGAKFRRLLDQRAPPHLLLYIVEELARARRSAE